MRLLIRIVGVILLGIIALLVLEGYISVRREVDLFDNDMARDGLLLARTMRGLVAATWENSGMDRALEIIDEANREEDQVEIRWVWLDAPSGDPFHPRLSADKLPQLIEDGQFSYKLTGRSRPGSRLTYVIVPVQGNRLGALEFSEPLTALSNYTRLAVIRTAALTVGMILLSWILIWLLGVRLLGRPLNVLVEKTRRVGAGDFDGDVALPGKEELSNLAAALNEMCAQLKTARETLRHETEARIATLEQLRHAERLAMVGRLASGIAHELGTPLSVVSGRAKIIATESLERDEITSFSKTIMDQANRMTEIIRQLLDFARRRSFQRTPVDVAQLVTQVVDLLAVTARKTGVFLQVENAGDLPPINLDRSQIQQMLVNLVMNGIQAMPKGGKLVIALELHNVKNPRIEDSTTRDHICIRVTDNGEGIPRENIKLIFDPFFTTKDVGKGTGLGLSISYGIVEEHGGWIDVQSELGRGTSFSVFLPLEERR